VYILYKFQETKTFSDIYILVIVIFFSVVKNKVIQKLDFYTIICIDLINKTFQILQNIQAIKNHILYTIHIHIK